MDNLPIPNTCELSSSQALTSLIKQQILQNNNWISFTDTIPVTHRNLDQTATSLPHQN